jgi:D-alanyl-D-alanine carboxypeptidase
MAVVLAEGVGGSIDGFSAMMNETAQRLGMTQTSYVNPNGLPADGQITSARDLAILARAIIRDLPEYEYFVHIPSIRFGRKITQNFNRLIGRFPGADGFKTGFICASGYNLVASATRDGRRLIAVVLGASSSAVRALKAAQLLERGFSSSTGGLSWLMPPLGTVETVQPVNVAPPNLRDEMCGAHRKRPATEDEDEILPANTGPESPYGIFLSSLSSPKTKAALLQDSNMGEPVLVYTGTKPPAPGAASEESKPKSDKKKTAKPAAAKQAATPNAVPTPSGDSPAPKPKPKKKAAPKPLSLEPPAS